MGTIWAFSLSLLVLAEVSRGFEWTGPESLPDQATIQTCAGQNVSLPWNYTLGSDEHIVDVEWYYVPTDGTGEVVLGTLVNGHFLSETGLRQKVEYIAGSDIRLMNVTAHDSGAYAIRVNVNMQGSIAQHEKTAHLLLTADPLIIDGPLHAQVEGAKFVNSSQQYHLILTCGTFNPQLVSQQDVVWTTPTADALPSSFHDNGTYGLEVPNPLVGGEYKCYIRPSSPAASCTSCNSSLTQGAKVFVDGVKWRLKLVEIQMSILAAEGLKLRARVDYLERNSLEIRLVGGYNSYEGRVEVTLRGKMGGAWGTICDDNWTNEDAQVVCRHMGFPIVNARGWTSSRFGQGTGAISMGSVRCQGTENNLLDCSFTSGAQTCGHSQDVGVTCGFDMRLSSGINEGTVQVRVGLEPWGTVCDDSWDDNDAKVVCRHLNLPVEGAVATSGAINGAGNGPIMMTKVACSGNETNLLDCPFDNNKFGVHNSYCQHRHDAGVWCQRLGNSTSAA